MRSFSRRSWDWEPLTVQSGAPTMADRWMTAGIAGRWLIAMTLGCLIPATHVGAGEKPEAVLQELVQMFPGHYDNTAQVQAEIARGVSSPHEAVALDIVPIESIMVGDNVFYVQES